MSIGTPTWKSSYPSSSGPSTFDDLLRRGFVPKDWSSSSGDNRSLFERQMNRYRPTTVPAVARRQKRALAAIVRRLQPRPLGGATFWIGGADSWDVQNFQPYSPPPGPANGLTYLGNFEHPNFPGRPTWGTDTGNKSVVPDTEVTFPSLWLRQVVVGNEPDPIDWVDGWTIAHNNACEPGWYHFRTNEIRRYRASIYTYFPRNVDKYVNNTTETIAEPWVYPLAQQLKKRWGPKANTSPKKYRTLRNITQRGIPPVPPGFELDTKGKPPHNVTEWKVRMTKSQYAIWSLINKVMGGLEAQQILYDASDGPPTRDPNEQFWYLYIEGGIHTVDWLELQEGIANDNWEDAIYGGLGELSAEASRGTGRQIGVSVGLAM